MELNDTCSSGQNSMPRLGTHNNKSLNNISLTHKTSRESLLVSDFVDEVNFVLMFFFYTL